LKKDTELTGTLKHQMKAAVGKMAVKKAVINKLQLL